MSIETQIILLDSVAFGLLVALFVAVVLTAVAMLFQMIDKNRWPIAFLFPVLVALGMFLVRYGESVYGDIRNDLVDRQEQQEKIDIHTPVIDITIGESEHVQ